MFNNILLEKRHRQLVILLRHNNADVICLQEVLYGVVDFLIKSLEKNYVVVNDDLGNRNYGELIFIKKGLKICDKKIIKLPSEQKRALQHVQISKENTIYNIVTFHLESGYYKHKKRSLQLRTLWLNFADLKNIILCGDTNLTEIETSNQPKHILDAWERTNGDIGRFTYYANRFWKSNNKQRYDRIWFSDKLTLTDFGILGSSSFNKCWISDHNGLFARFS